MANENLYQKYLGISASGKPDYYKLLGVASKESNPEKISAAAEQRIARLGKLQASGEQEEIELLTSEITEARDVLLNDQKRRQYEFEFLLKSSMKEKNSSSAKENQSPAQPEATPSVQTVSQPALDPFAFQQPPAQPQAPVLDPFAFQQPPAQPQVPVLDPFAFQQPPAQPQAPVLDPFAFQQPPQPVQPQMPVQPMQNPFGFQQPVQAPAQPTPFPSSGASAPASQPMASHSRKKAAKPDNTPYIIAVVGGVVILTIALWSMGQNSPRSQAEKCYNLAVTAVNSYRYDEARALMDRAVALDPQESYIKYRDSIDKKQKNHEYTMRHKAAREAEDEPVEEWK